MPISIAPILSNMFITFTTECLFKPLCLLGLIFMNYGFYQQYLKEDDDKVWKNAS